MVKIVRSTTHRIHTLVLELSDEELGALIKEMEANPKGRNQVLLYQTLVEYRDLPKSDSTE